MARFRTRVPMVLVLALAAGTSGCGVFGSLLGAPPSGVVTGLVTYGGRPAAGKRVTLTGGEPKTAATDANGRYTFSGVAPRKWQVQYRADGDPKTLSPNDPIPNEVAAWRSLTFDVVEGSGKEVPAFEVAYNGPLYPEAGMALVISAEAVVPFHWSVHPKAQRYRVLVDRLNGGRLWTSPWVGEPTVVFGQKVDTGSYSWTVEIEGGDSGTGTSRPRNVDF